MKPDFEKIADGLVETKGNIAAALEEMYSAGYEAGYNESWDVQDVDWWSEQDADKEWLESHDAVEIDENLIDRMKDLTRDVDLHIDEPVKDD